MIKVRDDDTYDVLYEDGDKELRVPLPRMRKYDVDLETKVELSEGMNVEARYKGKSKYFAGKIATMNEDGTFTVHYASGEVEEKVTKDLVRIMVVTHEDTDENQEVFEKGDEVEGNFKNAGKWFKGKIMKRHSAGTYNLEYEDGDKEINVPVANIRRINGSSKQKATTTPNTTVKTDAVTIVAVEAETRRFHEQQRVECNYKGQVTTYNMDASIHCFPYCYMSHVLR